MLKLLKAFYVWKVDETKGRKPWEDPTFLGLIVSFLATEVAKFWGLELGPEEQAGVVVIIGLVLRLLSPHVGIRPQTAAEVVAQSPSASVVDPQAGSAASQIAQEQKAEDMPVGPDHGAS